jgi:hypothetical protein
MPEHRNQRKAKENVAGRKGHILPAILLDQQ